MSLSKRGTFENLDIDTIEDVATIDVADYSVLWLQFAVAVASLTAFTVEYRTTTDAPWMLMASVAGDYTTPVHPVLKASGNLVTAAAGDRWVKLDVTGVHSVRVRAAGASSTIVGYYSKG